MQSLSAQAVQEEWLGQSACPGPPCKYYPAVSEVSIVNKVCVLDLVQLEDNIGFIKSSHTDLSSSN